MEIDPPAPGTPAPGDAPTWEQVRNAGIAAWNRGDHAAAERHLLDALSRAERGEELAGHPEASKRLVMQGLLDLGLFYAAHGTPPVADRLLVRALRLVEADPRQGPRSPAAAHVCVALSELRCRPRGYASAEALARRALDIRLAHPAFGPAHPEAARAMAALARSLLGRRKLSDAEAMFLMALTVYQRHPPAPQHHACGVLHGLADVFLARGEAAQAIQTHRQALEARQAVLPPDHDDVLDSLRRLGSAHVRLRQHDEAVPLFERLLSVGELRWGPHDQRRGKALYDLAGALRHDPFRARGLLEQALAIQENKVGPEHPALVDTLSRLAGACTALKRWDVVIALRRRILRIHQATLPDSDVVLINAVTNLCQACVWADEWGEAEALDQRALYLCEKHLGFEHPKLSRVLSHYAQVLRHLGKEDRAAQIADRANLLRAKLAAREDPDGPIEAWGGPAD